MNNKIVFSFLSWIYISGNLLSVGGYSTPKLPKQIETSIRFIKAETGETEHIELYYDQDRNIITAIIGKAEERQTYILSFDSDEQLEIQETKCKVEPISKIESSFVAYSIDENKKKQIKDFLSIFYFDPYNKSSPEELKLNGILVQKWETIGKEIQPINAVCNATHYITKEDENYQQIILIEAHCYNDEGEYDLNAEFFDTKNYITNPEIFQQPPGTYCENKKSKINFPTTPKYFAFDFETYDLTDDLKNKDVWNFHQSVWFDKENKLIRRDDLQQNFEVTSIQIGDYDKKIIYFINKKDGKFVMWTMGNDEIMEKGTLLPGETFPFFPETSNKEPQYVGRRKKHDLNFDVWVNQNKQEDFVLVSDYYFLNESGLEDKEVNVLSPVFLELKIIEREEVSASAWQMINKYRTHPIDWSVFDVSQWFDESNKLRLILSLEGSIGATDTDELTQILRSNLLKLLKISPLRLGVPQIRFFDDQNIKYSLTFNEQPYKLGFGVKTDEPSLEQVYENLKQNVINGNFKLSLSKEKVLKAVDLTKEQKEAKEDQSKHSGYSGGALIGVGIAMLILGILQGILLLTAYIRYRRTNR